jgi:hypothetical protein
MKCGNLVNKKLETFGDFYFNAITRLEGPTRIDLRDLCDVELQAFTFLFGV